MSHRVRGVTRVEPAFELNPGPAAGRLPFATISLQNKLASCHQEEQRSWLCPELISQKLAAEHLPRAWSWGERSLQLFGAG